MALNDHAAILQAVTNCMDGYIWCMGKELELLYMSGKTSDMISRIHGMSFKTGEKLLDKYALYDPQGAVEWRHLYELSLAGNPQQFVRQYQFGDHVTAAEISIKPFFHDNTFICLVCSAKELRADEVSRKQLEILETRFRALTENSLEGMALMNLQEEITYVSPSVQRILGYTPEEMLGSFRWDEVDPDDQAALRSFIHTIASHYGQSRETLIRVRHKNRRVEMDVLPDEQLVA